MKKSTLHDILLVFLGFVAIVLGGMIARTYSDNAGLRQKLEDSQYESFISCVKASDYSDLAICECGYEYDQQLELCEGV